MWRSQTPQVDKGVLYWWLINLKQFLMISFSLISAQRNNKIESFWVYSWLKTGSVHVHQTGAFISLVTTWHVFRSAAMKTVSMTVSRLGMTDLFTSASYCNNKIKRPTLIKVRPNCGTKHTAKKVQEHFNQTTALSLNYSGKYWKEMLVSFRPYLDPAELGSPTTWWQGWHLRIVARRFDVSPSTVSGPCREMGSYGWTGP